MKKKRKNSTAMHRKMEGKETSVVTVGKTSFAGKGGSKRKPQKPKRGGGVSSKEATRVSLI